MVDVAEEHRRRIAAAVRHIREAGQEPTAERIAERLDVSPRTVRRWQQMSA